MFFALVALMIAILIAISEGTILIPALAQITSPMRGTTGAGGANDVDDVAYAQVLLNDWRDRNNHSLISVDGQSGPQTETAIRVFQTAITGVVDGRLDPDGPAITALEQDHVNAISGNAVPAAEVLADAGGIPARWQPIFETPDDEEQPIAEVTLVNRSDALVSATQDYFNRLHDTAKDFG